MYVFEKPSIYHAHYVGTCNYSIYHHSSINNALYNKLTEIVYTLNIDFELRAIDHLDFL